MQLTNEQAEIVATCADDVRKALKDFHAPRVLLFDTRVVKFNDSTDILNEGDTQTFVYEALKDLQNAPRVPAIYDCFSWNRIHYLVMEKVDLPTVDAWIKDGRDEAERQSRFDMACQAVGNALASLFTLSPPVGTEIGQIQGSYAQTQNERGRSTSGYARSTFFGSIDGLRAPLRYTDALALERHVNKALNRRPRRAPRLTANIADEPLVMIQGDIKPYNFLIDPETLRVTLIDFGCVSALPHSFVSFTLHTTPDKFISGIAKSLGWPRSDNLLALVGAAGIYCMSGGRHFGLDKDGLPVRKA